MFKFKSIKSKLIVVTTISVVIALTVIGIIIVSLSSTALKNSIEDSRYVLAEQTAEQIRLEFEGIEKYVVGLGNNKSLEEYFEDYSEEHTKEVYEFLVKSQNYAKEDIETIGIINLDGIFTMSNDNRSENINLSERKYVQTALKGKTGISNVIESKLSGNVIVAMAVPIKDANGNVLGLFFAAIDFKAISSHVADADLGEEGYGFIIDNNGVIVSHPVEEKVLVENALEYENEELHAVISKMVLGDDGTGYYSYNGDEKFVAYYPVGDLSIGLTSTVNEYLAPVFKMAYIIIGIFLLALFLAIVGVYKFSSGISKKIITLKEAAEQLAKGNTKFEIDMNTNDELEQLKDSFCKVVDNIDSLIEETETIAEYNIKGQINKKGNEEKFEGGYKDVISGINKITSILAGHIDKLPLPVMLIDTEFNVQYMNPAGSSLVNKTSDEVQGTKCYDVFETDDCNTDKCACKRSMLENRIIDSETIAHPNGQNINIIYEAVPTKDENGNIIGALEIVQNVTNIRAAESENKKQTEEIVKQMQISQKQADYQNEEVEKLIKNIDELSKGNLSLTFDEVNYDVDTKEIALNFGKINSSLGMSTNTIKTYIEEIAVILGEVANKNLTGSIENEYVGDFIKLKDSINYILKQLNEVLCEVNETSEQVGVGAEQLAESSQTLSRGAEEQASSVEQIGATVSQISVQTKENANNAKKAFESTRSAKDNAEKGNKQMGEMLHSMSEIKDSSKDIAKIIKVIDEIAFQTNILALNAAVEAARAGEHGRGFAVVAEEVRSLAARSANAASETTEMIDSSINKIEDGYNIANETAEAFSQIVSGVEEISVIIDSIEEASSSQAIAIAQVDSGVHEVSNITQSNSASAEETASASAEMAQQSISLKNMIGEFRLK